MMRKQNKLFYSAIPALVLICVFTVLCILQQNRLSRIQSEIDEDIRDQERHPAETDNIRNYLSTLQDAHQKQAILSWDSFWDELLIAYRAGNADDTVAWVQAQIGRKVSWKVVSRGSQPLKPCDEYTTGTMLLNLRPDYEALGLLVRIRCVVPPGIKEIEELYYNQVLTVEGQIESISIQANLPGVDALPLGSPVIVSLAGIKILPAELTGNGVDVRKRY